MTKPISCCVDDVYSVASIILIIDDKFFLRCYLVVLTMYFIQFRIELLSVLIAVSFSDQSPGCSPRLFRIWKKSKTSISDLDMRCYRG
ncbi:hypothetical protein PRUPE_1G449800 [Prunus persica]|uniref:Uncharacterized protein n=1 Tax=Prunus persica TaxID=3760 RepID=A0A251RCW1_PRUPE|nr:hypothetical protein PRUPE_1G449800 [Prunus persica]